MPSPPALSPNPKSPLPKMQPDYLERTYAGVLGKIIGVYLGRPFEGWSHAEILDKLGEVDYYVNDRLNVPLVVTDDDISGTFTFLRALADYGNSSTLTPEQIGQTWMNYIIENRTILWWGGLGMSTEHTAFLRMKHGIMPPSSGSIEKNGQVVAEQIGAQIFIDGWGLIHPGDPERAADFARRAGSVSHDGVAIHCAQIVAALVAQAFVESDLDRLIDSAIRYIPRDSLIQRMISDIREWHAEGLDWKAGFNKIEGHYGYDKYGGNCHTVPNHAIIIHALLHSRGDFQRALTIANTCGWDTDCNSGNVGCIMGVRNGLSGINSGPDWRGPIGDKIYLPTADGGRCISNAVTETFHVINAARALRDLGPVSPKGGARFHFELPGSVQGFHGANCQVSNVEGHSALGSRALSIQYNELAAGTYAKAQTDTFPSPDAKKMGGYDLVASPTLYSGQTIRARVVADSQNETVVIVALEIGRYGEDDGIHAFDGSSETLFPGDAAELEWTLPDIGAYPIAEVGIKVLADQAISGAVYLDYLTWEGAPNVVFMKTEGTSWKSQWVCGVSEHATWGEPFRLVQNEGTGLLMTGCREWTDYRVEASVTPHLVVTGGIAARVQGMKRYYALVLVRGGGVRLIKALDGVSVMAEASFTWQLGETHELAIEVCGSCIKGFVNGQLTLEVEDNDCPLTGGGVALILTEGRMATTEVRVHPLLS